MIEHYPNNSGHNKIIKIILIETFKYAKIRYILSLMIDHYLNNSGSNERS